ncbi:MAG: dihydroorotate dehydrogenase electron transfer subunit, partial [Chloroflexi bacterium]|nr:dihydroorotate dehydrogenase electron transfer subunit [Chloroflexota bacterium]
VSELKLERARIVSQEELYADTYLMWLSCPAVARGASPGRFLMIHCADSLDPLLPRPMSFHRFRDTGGERQFAILYDVRGRGTAWLSERKGGDALTVFGPLGRGFEVDAGSENILLVAGGLGIAAVVSLGDEAVAAGRSVTLLQGARTASQLCPPEHLPAEVEAISATDDGSEGHAGRVTELLAKHMPWADQVFACGPTPMFEAMAAVVREMRTRKPVQVLLEERMGCGTGVCYGCAVFTRKGVRLVCRDGPQMELREAFG